MTEGRQNGASRSYPMTAGWLLLGSLAAQLIAAFVMARAGVPDGHHWKWSWQIHLRPADAQTVYVAGLVVGFIAAARMVFGWLGQCLDRLFGGIDG